MTAARLARILVVISVAVGLLLGTQAGSAAPLPAYTDVVFSDGFESGSLAAWDGTPGTGTAVVAAAAARSGGYGLRLTNAPGQYSLVVKRLASPLVDSAVSFWVRVGSPGSPAGRQLVAQARDDASSSRMWDLMYDGARRGFFFYPFRGATSTEIWTGARTVDAGSWVRIEVQYTATAAGSAQLYVNGKTKNGWRVSGDYTRSTNFQRLQLWNDAANTTDFDDIGVSTLPPPVASPPGAPTAVTGAPGNQTVALSWTAPASNGGSAITGHRVTPYVGGSAQTPIATGSAATSYTVTGLTNGTAYTFRVAAINAVGTGPDSAASAPVTPTAPPPAAAATTVVSLTFDDGSWTQWSARQTLRDHNMRATFYVNSGLTTDQPGGWRMTWSQLRDLAADGHEIGGHGLTHPDFTQLTPEAQRREACDDRTNLLNRGFSPVASFAYPYARYSQSAMSAVQQCGYTSARTVHRLRSSYCNVVVGLGIALLSLPRALAAVAHPAVGRVRDHVGLGGRPTCPVAETIPPLNPFATRTPPDIRSTTTLAMMQSYVTQAENNGGGWVQLVFHEFDAAGEFSTSLAQLVAFLDWLQPRAANGTVVRTVAEVMGATAP